MALESNKNIFYREGYKATLAVEYRRLTSVRPKKDIITPFYEIYTNGLVVSKIGYAFDFATGAFDTDTIKKAALVHDIICQAIIDGLLDPDQKRACDNEFKIICKESGMCRFRVWYTYRAVDLGSCRGKPKPIKSAPSRKAADKFKDLPIRNRN